VRHPHPHFKMEDLKVVADILCPEDFMCKIDLKDVYFAVPIHPEHQKLHCFQFKNVTYRFKCLPLGLTSAPRVFTKVLKPLVAFVRRLGLRICIYIDNIFFLYFICFGVFTVFTNIQKLRYKFYMHKIYLTQTYYTNRNTLYYTTGQKN